MVLRAASAASSAVVGLSLASKLKAESLSKPAVINFSSFAITPAGDVAAGEDAALLVVFGGLASVRAEALVEGRGLDASGASIGSPRMGTGAGPPEQRAF